MPSGRAGSGTKKEKSNVTIKQKLKPIFLYYERRKVEERDKNEIINLFM